MNSKSRITEIAAILVSMCLVALLAFIAIISLGETPLSDDQTVTGDRKETRTALAMETSANSVSQIEQAETPTPAGPPPPIQYVEETLYPTPQEPIRSIPTLTPLPKISTEQRQGFWTENLRFGETSQFAKGYPNRYKWISWAPDGTKVAFSAGKGEFVINEEGDPIRELTSIAIANKFGEVEIIADGFYPVWSPSQEFIAFQTYDDSAGIGFVKIIGLASKKEIEVIGIPKGEEFTTMAWISPSELVFYKKEPLVFDTRNNTITSLLEEDLKLRVDTAFPLKYFTAAVIGGVFAAGSTHEILLLRWEDGRASLIRHLKDGLDHDAWALSPDGEFLAYVGASWQLRIASTKEDKIINLPFDKPTSPSWAPDSTAFVFKTSNGTIVTNRDGSGFTEISTLETVPLGWATDGSIILFAENNDDLLAMSVFKE